jgi:hypothetical protein
MRSYPMPEEFDGVKFATRYGLDPESGAFWSDGKQLFVPDTLPDDPPIFEPPDPPQPRIALRLEAVKNLSDLIQLLKEELQ